MFWIKGKKRGLEKRDKKDARNHGATLIMFILDIVRVKSVLPACDLSGINLLDQDWSNLIFLPLSKYSRLPTKIAAITLIYLCSL